MVLLAQVALTPAGNPFAPDTPEFEIPVTPEVECVIGVNAVFIVKVGELDAADTARGLTVIVPLALILHFPPVVFMVYGNVPDTIGVPVMLHAN
jgi:hypothetical protein